MRIKDLRRILSEIQEEYDDQPVFVNMGKNKYEVEKLLALSGENWELGGTTIPTTFLKLEKE